MIYLLTDSHKTYILYYRFKRLSPKEYKPISCLEESKGRLHNIEQILDISLPYKRKEDYWRVRGNRKKKHKINRREMVTTNNTIHKLNIGRITSISQKDTRPAVRTLKEFQEGKSEFWHQYTLDVTLEDTFLQEQDIVQDEREVLYYIIYQNRDNRKLIILQTINYVDKPATDSKEIKLILIGSSMTEYDR